MAGASVHLGLWGLLGVVLGRRAFPAVFAALAFQALFLGHGGVLALGVNVVNMALGALCGWRTQLDHVAVAGGRRGDAAPDGALLRESLEREHE